VALAIRNHAALLFRKELTGRGGSSVAPSGRGSSCRWRASGATRTPIPIGPWNGS